MTQNTDPPVPPVNWTVHFDFTDPNGGPAWTDGMGNTYVGGGAARIASASISPLTGTGQSNRGCPFGHTADENYIEYYDGIVASRCTTCGDRIIMPRVPGGVSLLHIKAILGMVMGATDESDLSHVLGEFADLRAALENEEFCVEEGRRLLGMAEQLLRQKVKPEDV